VDDSRAVSSAQRSSTLERRMSEIEGVLGSACSPESKITFDKSSFRR